MGYKLTCLFSGAGHQDTFAEQGPVFKPGNLFPKADYAADHDNAGGFQSGRLNDPDNPDPVMARIRRAKSTWRSDEIKEISAFSSEVYQALSALRGEYAPNQEAAS